MRLHIHSAEYGSSLLTRPHSGAHLVVMGVGNEFRRDDGVGPFIVQKLRAEKWSIQNLSLECCQGFSLIESWKGATMAVVLDAVISGAVPGKIYRFEAYRGCIPSQFFKCSTHNLGVAEAIELGRALNRLPRYLIVYGIEGKSFDQGVGLSPEVEKAAKEVVESVFRDIMG